MMEMLSSETEQTLPVRQADIFTFPYEAKVRHLNLLFKKIKLINDQSANCKLLQLFCIDLNLNYR